jgi:hypothetical protein
MALLRNDHNWFVPWRLSEQEIRRTAQMVANRCGESQVLHQHTADESCIASCELIEPAQRWFDWRRVYGPVRP